MPGGDCPVCRAPLPPGATHCARCGIRVAALPRRRGEVAGTAPPGERPHLGPGRPAEAVGLGLAGGVTLLAVALLAAAVTRLAGGDAVAALGNASLLLGMLTFGAATLSGRPRPGGPLPAGRRGAEGLPRRGAAGTGAGRGLLGLSMALAGALPFGLFVVLAALH
jgi:hypothetical protein